jgi:hypothetical protein
MFYVVLIGIIVGGYFLIQWAMRKAERQGRAQAERQLRGGGPQGPSGGV